MPATCLEWKPAHLFPVLMVVALLLVLSLADAKKPTLMNLAKRGFGFEAKGFGSFQILLRGFGGGISSIVVRRMDE